MKIDKYVLGEQLPLGAPMRELTPGEYDALPKTFVEEKIFDAGTVIFLGHTCRLTVGSVGGRVWKLAMQFIAQSSRKAVAIASGIAYYCDTNFGESSIQPGGAITIWATDFGNVVLDLRSLANEHFVDVFFTHASAVASSTGEASGADFGGRMSNAEERIRGLQQLEAAHAGVVKLTNAIEQLQSAMLVDLTVHYSKRDQPSDALLLANCVLTHIMCIEPFGEDGLNFKGQNVDLVVNEACRVPSIERVGTAASYLYAALTLLIAMRTGNPFSEAAMILGERATALGIPIAHPQEISDGNDAFELIDGLSKFAHAYRFRSPTP